jgi:hypothetical protein
VYTHLRKDGQIVFRTMRKGRGQGDFPNSILYMPQLTIYSSGISKERRNKQLRKLLFYGTTILTRPWILIHKFPYTTRIVIYGPMIYTAQSVMVLRRSDPLRGQVGGGWALEIEIFLGPDKGHRAVRRVPFGAKKGSFMYISFQGP